MAIKRRTVGAIVIKINIVTVVPLIADNYVIGY